MQSKNIGQKQMGLKKVLPLVLVLSQTLSVIPLTELSVLAASPASKTGGPISSLQRLDDFEEIIYGEPRKYLTMDARLKELEAKLFGGAQTGTYDQRISRISSALAFGAESTGNFQSQAPKLDTTGGSTKTTSSYSTQNPSYQVDSSAALEEAMQLYSEGRVGEAESAFHTIIARDPRNADAYYNLGVIQEGKNDLPGALSSYRKAQELSPAVADYKSAVNSLEMKLGPAYALNKAPASSTTAAKPPSKGSKPTQTAARPPAKPVNTNTSASDKLVVEQATMDFKQGRYDQAIDKLRGVAVRNPNDADIQYAIGQAYRAKGDLIGAQSSLARAAQLAPNNTLYSGSLQNVQDAMRSGGGGIASAAGQPQPSGELTPFANSKASPLTGSATSSANHRLKRAITYGMAGAATGVLASTLLSRGGNKTNMKRLSKAAIGGAVAGGLLGLMLGK